jgi:septation ring formation regulator EzrA
MMPNNNIDNTVLQMIYEGVQELKKDSRETKDTVGQIDKRLINVEASIRPLFDNGQPGTLSRMQKEISDITKELEDHPDYDDLDEVQEDVKSVQKDVNELKTWKAKVIGYTTACSTIGAGIATYLIQHFSK